MSFPRRPNSGGGGGGGGGGPQGGRSDFRAGPPRGGRGYGDRNQSPDDGPRLAPKPPLRVFTTTHWEYPSQHYGDAIQGDAKYVGATPSWVIWQCLQRYTREGDTVVDPMCGSGTTLDVCADLGRQGIGFDLAPQREDIQQADARRIPLAPGAADFVFIDPPYSTHIDYSEDPACIGKLDSGGEDGGQAYYTAMHQVIHECHRILKPERHLALYVSDSWRKSKGGDPGAGTLMPIGFELFAMMSELFKPADIICVVRHNVKLDKPHWHKAAEEGNYFLRGFNYLFLMRKEAGRGARTLSSRRD